MKEKEWDRLNAIYKAMCKSWEENDILFGIDEISDFRLLLDKIKPTFFKGEGG